MQGTLSGEGLELALRTQVGAMVGAQLALLLLPQRDPKRMKHANEPVAPPQRGPMHSTLCMQVLTTAGADALDARQRRALAPAPSQLLVRPTYATKPATRAPGANRRACVLPRRLGSVQLMARRSCLIWMSR